MSREYPCVYYDDLKCRRAPEDGLIDWCVLGPCSHETPSRADRIRAMSDEELAEKILDGISSDPCDYCGHQIGYCDGSPCRGKAEAEIIAEWLRQPAEEDGV